ncbi:MAG: DUF4336 domain-containing protein [Gammaproteobacteria bacterium]|nr:DUF4336 domain-containing protein [Gammaproteobacteria bacterium]
MALEAFGTDIWTMDGDQVSMYSIPFCTRMTIVRLPGNLLWLHSPVAASVERMDDVDRLGNVKYVVAPNVLHHLFVCEWAKAYPQADLWGPSGLSGIWSDITGFGYRMRASTERSGEMV